jgi:hypothetical protein
MSESLLRQILAELRKLNGVLPVRGSPTKLVRKYNRTVGLSVRAIKAIWRNEDEYMADLTEDLLWNTRNCGRSTINEVLRWKERVLDEEAIQQIQRGPQIAADSG